MKMAGIREKAWKAAKEGGCRICGLKDIEVLTDHHIDRQTKILLCYYHHEEEHLICQLLIGKILRHQKNNILLTEEELISFIKAKAHKKLRINFLEESRIKQALQHLKEAGIIRNGRKMIIQDKNRKLARNFLNFIPSRELLKKIFLFVDLPYVNLISSKTKIAS